MGVKGGRNKKRIASFEAAVSVSCGTRDEPGRAALSLRVAETWGARAETAWPDFLGGDGNQGRKQRASW